MAEGRVRASAADGRDDTTTERLDRNRGGLLQELRVLQTGTQLLTGFLLTIAFQPVFRQLAGWQVVLCPGRGVAGRALDRAGADAGRAAPRAPPAARDGRAGGLAGRVVRAGVVVTGLAIVGALALVFSTAAGVLALALVARLWSARPRRTRGSVRSRPGHPSA